MARSTITAKALSRNAGTDITHADIKDDIDADNGNEVVVDDGEKLLIHVKHTTGSEKDVTVKAGDYTAAGIGDLTVAMDATNGEVALVLETARFKNSSDGKIYLDWEDSNVTGTVAAYTLP